MLRWLSFTYISNNYSDKGTVLLSGLWFAIVQMSNSNYHIRCIAANISYLLYFKQIFHIGRNAQ